MKIAEIHDLLDEHEMATDYKHLYNRVKIVVEQHNKMNECIREITKYCVAYPNENPVESILNCIKELTDGV